MRLVQIEHGSLCCCGKLSELGKNPGEECVSYFGELCRSPSEKVCFDFPLFFLLTWLDSVVLSLTSAEQSRRTTHRRKHWWIQAGKKIMIKTQMLHFKPGWVSSSRPEGLFLLPALFLYELGALLICECCPLSAEGSATQNRASGPEEVPAAAAGQNQGWSGTFCQSRDWWSLWPETWW